MLKTIYLNHGKQTIVDDVDYKYLCVHRWRYNTTGYATRTFRSISMARVILNAKKGEYVDHINGNKLDNRRCNIRIVTNQQNTWNKRNIGLKNSVGVSKLEKKWRAYHTKDGRQICLGRFNDRISAMKAYDNAILKTRGIYAITNKMLGNY